MRVHRRVLALAIAFSASALLAACASAGFRPGGNARDDAARGANRGANRDAQRDALLSALERGLAALDNGDGAGAADAFDRAYWLNEARVTHSLSAGATAFVTSDLALPYRPSATELAMLHYYGARGWLAQGRTDEAVVDARRLSALLADVAEREEAFAPQLMATFHDVAAALYEAAGDWADAGVAARLRDGFAGTTPAAPCDSCGELVIFAERGRVTHRVPRSLTVAMVNGELSASPRHCGWSRRAVCGWDRHGNIDGPFTLVHVAWPALAPPVRAEGELALLVGEHRVRVAGGGDVSEAVAVDFARDAPARIGRAAARALARQGMVKAGEAAMTRAKKAKKEERESDEDAWRVAGVAAFVLAGVSTLAERADTRSWASLPDQLSVTRVSLPPGTYTVRGGEAGGAVIADVRIVRGVVTILTVRE